MVYPLMQNWLKKKKKNKYINKIKVYVCLYKSVEVENLIIMMLVFVHSVY